ncbi:glycosyltransferase family 2 protein [Dietzia maris]
MSSKIAVVTASYNRVATLARLHHSLCAQTSGNFTWVVIDDNSADDTFDRIIEFQQTSTFEIRLLKNEANRGKCASLNRAFDEVEFDFFLVVDSDDTLESDAIERVRIHSSRYRHDPEVGALFFRFSLPSGSLLGPRISGNSYRATRSESDKLYGKYDGVIGYYRRAIEDYRYPEFSGETYLGPTVLQMAMEDRYSMVFVQESIGTAYYQNDGLTKSGRALRLRNPLGMMHYSGLMVERSEKYTDRFKYKSLYEAYRRRADPGQRHNYPELSGSSLATKVCGFGLHRFWKIKYEKSWENLLTRKVRLE